jgi:hypothetical protein
MRYKVLFLLTIFFNISAYACTIVSGVDARGQTWVMNNEDFFHTYSNYVNVYPAQKDKLGYMTLTYGSAESGIQGGVNEAGVFFDINALPAQEYTLSKGKKPFASGSMLEYLMQHCKTVPQFLKLWENYYMPGMTDIQIHLADKDGNLAVITPDSIIHSKKQLTSTNFNVCESDPSKRTCWRYPIAQKAIAAGGINRENLVHIASVTSWREFTTTLYTNIHNLSTGEICFYLAEDYTTPWLTNIHALLKGGKRSILLASKFPGNAGLNLNRLMEDGGNAEDLSKFLHTGSFDDGQKDSMLRLSFLNYFYIEKDFKKAGLILPEWEKVMFSNTRLDSTEIRFTKAQYLAAIGKDEEAIKFLKGIKQPNGRSDALLHSLLDTGDYNAIIKLKGYNNANAIAMEVKGDYNLFRVLRKTTEGWMIKLKTDRKEVKYCFYADGKRVVDNSKPIIQKQETVKGDYADFNILKL